MQPQNVLQGFSFKDGWVDLNDFVMDCLNLDPDRENKTYMDCVFNLGYQEQPIYKFGEPDRASIYVYVNMINQGLPRYFVEVVLSAEDTVKHVVCADYISLLELLAKFSPIVSLSMWSTDLVQ